MSRVARTDQRHGPLHGNGKTNGSASATALSQAPTKSFDPAPAPTLSLLIASIHAVHLARRSANTVGQRSGGEKPLVRGKIGIWGWRRIDPIFGDVNPRTISLGDLSRWRSHIARSTSLREAHRALKIWRALWKVVAAQGYCERNSDPSLAIRNEAPAPRQAIWTEGEVVRLCKAAWRSGYFGLAGVIAVAWDTQLSPVDVRGLQISQLAADKVGSLFLVDRAKTGRAAAGTLSTRTTALISAYAAKLDGKPDPSAPVFRNRSGAKYTKDTLGDDFRAIRLNVFGASESRTLADFRRSGAVEAMAGGVHAEHLSAKMANTLSVSNALHKTYTPVDIVSVRSADSARRQGRARLRENK